MYPLENNLK